MRTPLDGCQVLFGWYLVVAMGGTALVVADRLDDVTYEVAVPREVPIPQGAKGFCVAVVVGHVFRQKG